MSETALNKGNILKYWCQYFPEIDETELDNIISFMGEIKYEALIQEYNSYDDFEQNDIEQLVDFQYCPFIDTYKEWFGKQQMFTPCILPIVNKHFKKLEDGYFRNELLVDYQEFWKHILDHINFKIYQNLYKSIIYEVGYQKKSGQLVGEDSRARMQYFQQECLGDEGFLRKFYQEYYAITRVASSVAEAQLQYVKEILRHTGKHRKELQQELGIPIEQGSLKKLSLGKGDIHQNGRSVAVLELENGAKLLYKPHEIAIDNQFSKLLKWLKQHISDVHDFRMPKSFSTKTYGFTEFVTHCECKSTHEVRQFYERIGELLAVLYSLNSSDIHYENIIACGEYPILIDLETLVHPQLVNKNEKAAQSAYVKAQKKYNSSVTTIGMLPTYMKGNLEVGGLGAAKAQNSTFKTEFVENVQEDSVHIVRKYFKIMPEQNNPVLNGTTVDSSKYIEEIKKGFARVYQWISTHRDMYVQCITGLFNGCSGRLVIRPTLFYSQLLNISLHPEFSRKINERRLILYRTVKEQYKDFPDVVEAEHKDLMTGNIPYFTYEIGKCSVRDSRGNLLETQVEAVLEKVCEKINDFSDKDLNTQLQYIEDSYITRKNQADRTYLRWRTYQNELKPEAWLKTASSIGEYIGENAIEGVNERGRRDTSWICVTLQGFEEDVWIPSVLGHELYSGNAGIALFFAYLWKVTQKKCFLDSARKAAEIPLTLLEEQYVSKKSSVGAFTGISGSAYMLYALAEVTEDAALKKEAEDMMLRYGKLIPYEQSNDVIGGAAGYLAVALKMAKSAGRKEAFDRLIALLAEHLVQNAVCQEDKVFWNCMSGKPYCGFSHGSAGIHAYLYLAMKYLGSDKYQDIMERSLRYERSCYSPKEGNWLRSDTERTVSNAWCHGAPGILLSKLMMQEAGMQGMELERETEIALKLTQNYGFGNNPTYCHGDLGNMAIINYAGRVLGRPGLCNENVHAFQQLYDNVLSKKWQDRNYKSCNTYGLMIGLAGWGYALISNYAQGEIPEFLWLE